MKDNKPEILALENNCLLLKIVPSLGGKITSVFNKQLNKEFLWHNASLDLKRNEPGADYDINFWGGIDELLPNDIPEAIDGIAYPDHGELWTTYLDYIQTSDKITVRGLLPLSELFYEKEISLFTDKPMVQLKYKITNQSPQKRHFLWKLHAALQINEGDRMVSDARTAKIVYPDSSRFKDMRPFNWPKIEEVDASVVPDKNNTMDFFYLYDTPVGEMSILSNGGKYKFSYQYDSKVFPYQWYFASYGKFFNHYTAILEPASAMPVSVNEAADLKQCSTLDPGESIETIVTIYAGPNR